MHTSLCLFSMHVSASKHNLSFLSLPQKVLAANGAGKVSAYVTHGVFPIQSWLQFTHKDDASKNAFAYFWITDSCPVTVKALANQAPFEVLSLARSIADALQI
ncbi:putative ribose-phosphate diphosphokinase [Medicago truncatula]|uniref:Putative ribose-phosphate diphosphokinase n=1 Tax=Medicago truncatula TaxID=3880 RepID=A0A396IR73_MEDTR|nr:putative ribose-phosphate diphosphokinase [Medicago truncatula]